MPLTLDATVGTTTANSYLDEAGAQALLDAVPNAAAWTAATSAARQQALVAATAMLDVLAFQGVRFAQLQSLQWPRGGVIDPDYGSDSATVGYMTKGKWGYYLDYTTIPKRVKRACAQLALAILRAGTSDVWGVESTLNIHRDKVDVLETEYVDPAQRRYGLRALPAVWREVYPLTLAAEPRKAERA